MADNLSKDKSVRTEQLIRNKNKRAVKAIKKYFHNDKKIEKTPLKLDCECSDPSCDKHVKVAIDTFEKIHERDDRFVIKKGHETPRVENIVAAGSDHDIVEKERLKP